MPRIAVISVAHIHSRQYCDALAKTTSGKAPHLVWDDNPIRGAKYAADFKCRFEPDLCKAVADPEIEGFVICAENTRHLPLLRQVLPVGKPVMCEKPLATSAAEAGEIVALARRCSTPLVCGYYLPFAGANRSVRKLLDEEGLGKVTHINFRNAHHAAYARWFDSPDLSWFTDPALSGGGALLDMGTHAVQFLRHLGGPVAQVWADIRNLSGAYPDVDDYGLIIMRFRSGVIGRAEAGWVFTGGHGGLEIIGSRKSLWNSGGLLVGAPGTAPAPLPPMDDRPRQVARLLAVVRGELPQDEIDEDLEASLDAVRIMEAAYASSKAGAWVDL